MTSEIDSPSFQRESIPCCICYKIQETPTIIEYRCKQCNEGVVCIDCAVELWKSIAKNKCPICNNESNPPNTWYKSYDVEFGHIKPPVFDNAHDNNANDNNANDNAHDIRCNTENCVLTLSLISITLFIAFILGTLIKVFEGICTWDCDDIPNSISIITSIGYGIIAMPIIILMLCGVACIVGIIAECIKSCGLNIHLMIQGYNNRHDETLFTACKNYIKHKVKILCIFLAFIIMSFCTGTLFRIFTNQCYWSCTRNTVFHTILTSIIIGMPILLLSMLMLLTIFAIIASCFITCIEFRNGR